MYRQTPDHEGLQPLPRDPGSDLHTISYDNYAEVIKLHPDSTPKYFNGHRSPKTDPPPAAAAQNSSARWQRRRLLAIAVLLLVAVLGVAITVPLSLRARTQSPSTPSDPTSSSSPSSQSLIFNSAAIATAGDVNTPTYIYFQHSDRSIWQYAVSGNGDNKPISASQGIRNATPIAATSYGSGYNHTRHVVYVDVNNILRDIYEVNSTGTWWNGTMGAAGFEVSTSSAAGLSAVQFRQSGPIANTISLRVFFSGTDNRIHMATFTPGDTTWREAYIFPTGISGDSGFAAIQPDISDIQVCYLGADSKQNLRWFAQSTGAEPTAEWSGGGESSGISVNPGAQVAAVSNELVVYQDPSNTVHALNITTINDITITNETVTFDHACIVDSAMPQTPLAARVNPIPTIWIPTTDGNIAEYKLDMRSWAWIKSSILS